MSNFRGDFEQFRQAAESANSEADPSRVSAIQESGWRNNLVRCLLPPLVLATEIVEPPERYALPDQRITPEWLHESAEIYSPCLVFEGEGLMPVKGPVPVEVDVCVGVFATHNFMASWWENIGTPHSEMSKWKTAIEEHRQHEPLPPRLMKHRTGAVLREAKAAATAARAALQEIALRPDVVEQIQVSIKPPHVDPYKTLIGNPYSDTYGRADPLKHDAYMQDIFGVEGVLETVQWAEPIPMATCEQRQREMKQIEQKRQDEHGKTGWAPHMYWPVNYRYQSARGGPFHRVRQKLDDKLYW